MSSHTVIGVRARYTEFLCVSADVEAAAAFLPSPPYPPPIRTQMPHACANLTPFLQTNHIKPVHSHQSAAQKAIACDSRSPRQPTYVHARKRRLALQSWPRVGSICLCAQQNRIHDNEIWPHSSHDVNTENSTLMMTFFFLCLNNVTDHLPLVMCRQRYVKINLLNENELQKRAVVELVFAESWWRDNRIRADMNKTTQSMHNICCRRSTAVDIFHTVVRL